MAGPGTATASTTVKSQCATSGCAELIRTGLAQRPHRPCIQDDVVFPLGSLCSQIAARGATITEASVTVNGRTSSSVDLRSSVSPCATAAPTAATGRPVAELRLAGVAWDLTAPLGQIYLRDLTLKVTLRVNKESASVVLNRAYANALAVGAGSVWATRPGCD